MDNSNTINYTDNSDYLPPTYLIENDVENYLLSFSIEQEDEYKSFFKKFGFVVIRDILNKKQCQKTIDDILEYVESFKWASYTAKESDKTIKRDDPKTWKTWPNLAAEGIVGYSPIFSDTTIENRSNPKIYDVYTQLLNRKDLYINHDRYGFFRPTKQVLHPFPQITPDHHVYHNKLKDESLSTSATATSTKEDYENWKTVHNLHLDMNPFLFLEDENDEHRQKIFSTLNYKHGDSFFIENNNPGSLKLDELHIQGLINLCDNKDEDGGFILVPGFHNHLEEWTKNNHSLKMKYGLHQDFICVPPENKIYNQAIRITARAGSLILWNQKMLHGSKPNNSGRPRLAMFVKMFPSTQIPKETLNRRCESIKESFEKHNNHPIETSSLTDTQKKVLGLEFW
ncbi:hypothetical protein DICPUDRAFT_52501 [Dictyostelium purpureum]|uniref:Phytanoyl-CoA dioxygenase n=1 Tax=Dictyostelium purpureum TaxID=5786 RepID=F0Z8M3_DICPU|nr:uncharacterized protein DICPUDRAFT_52501 [Dictyostelium purpureum]EGC39683.1 hypothetical protein DICPUDRAFT_52501 [Dictyostelium purpureum]|eukprot:XP_003283792.1 hypothetical protein DICPUDRAFT_52501 [Dictyostelium purpureum]